MTSANKRDIKCLRREDLLDDYWNIAKKRKGALVATALRTRSTSMRDILVYGATQVTTTSERLKELLFSGTFSSEHVSDVEALADLARLVLLQNIFNDDLLYAEKLFRLALACSPNNELRTKNLLAWAQYLVISGNRSEAESLLQRFPKIDEDYFSYLKAELLNPFSYGSEKTADQWLNYFNSVFLHNNVAPISIADSDLAPFDRVVCEIDPINTREVPDQRLVSVVLTSYKPDAVAFRTSVESILNQTWTNLELIIVDDCSGPDYRAVFEEVRSLDDRVKVIHSSANNGTYVSRNIGYAAARGDFITGQDDDDWSHPERLEEQIRYLDENPEDIGCRVTAIRADEHLCRVRVGYSPMGENASSLLIRREGYEAVGEYLPARKGADTEYHFRLEKVTGRPVGRVRAPLTIIRILQDSLSRGDFSAGWKHTSRRSFRSSYEYWHENKEFENLKLESGRKPPVKIPRRFLPSRDRPEHIDVIFAGNWDRYGGPQKSMLEEIRALLQAGYHVGILNFEAARFMSGQFQKPLTPEIQSLVNDGQVDEVHFDDHLNVRLLLLRYPPILQFFTHDKTNLNIKRMAIVANQAPAEMNGQDIRYRVQDCHETAKRAFKIEPTWVPQGPQVRDFLEFYLEFPLLEHQDLPGVLNIKEWWRDRKTPRSLTPVVGRHSRDDQMKWPNSAKVIEEVYRTDGSYDIRILGGARVPLKIIKKRLLTTGWTVYGKNEIPVESFLQSLDYYVFYQHSQAVEAFGRAILEALASGLVVVLPKHFRRVFGEAAVYADPDEVENTIRTYHSNFVLYKKQLAKSRAYLDAHFSYEACVTRIERLMGSERALEIK